MVINWEQFGDRIATIVVASLAWISGLVASDVPAGSPAAAVSSAHVTDLPTSFMRWAQQEEEPPIEQVGEDTEADVETLDNGGPPADETEEDVETLDNGGPPADEDIELLDQGPPAGAQDDGVELLDQGPPPATVADSPAPATVTTVPVTTYVAPATTSGPALPEGFGTGDVHVATGSTGFPVGLEDCHVGAVTGRAYVGIDCGEGSDSSFVGHAPSFEEFPFVLDEGFPFVLDENFPFGSDSVFADRDESALEADVEALISAARGTPLDDGAVEPEIRTSGASSAEFAQRTRDRKPRVEADDGGAKRGNGARRGGNVNASASEAQDEADRTTAQSEHQKKSRGKDGDRGGSTGDGKKKSNRSDNSKNDGGGKKDKKSRTRK
jgi:hypothetical protein